MTDEAEDVVYPVHMPGETVMAPVTWDEWRALLDVAEQAGRIGDINDHHRLAAALDRLEEVRRA